MFNYFLYILLSFIVLFPKPILTINSYPIYSVYILLPFIVTVMPVVLLKKKYWQNSVTKYCWLLRIIFVFIFLSSSFYMGLTPSRLISFVGIISITFFYELPFILDIDLKKFFRIYDKIFILFLVYSTIIIFYYLIQIQSPKYIIGYVREYLPMYPNYFSMILVIHLCARFYLLKRKKTGIIIDIWIITLIILTLSRTALLGLITFTILYIALNDKLSIRKKLISLILIAFLLTPLSYLILTVKGASYGSTLQYTFLTRFFRWESALDAFSKHPFIGYGFDRTINIVKYYSHFNEERLVKLGSMHNDYFDLLVKSGAIGLLAFFMFCIKILQVGIKKNKCLFFLMLLLLIFAIFQNPFKNCVLMFYLYFITGGFMTKSSIDEY